MCVVIKDKITNALLEIKKSAVSCHVMSVTLQICKTMACWISNLIQIYEKYDGHQDYLLTSVYYLLANLITTELSANTHAHFIFFFQMETLRGLLCHSLFSSTFSLVVFNILFYYLVVGSHKHSVLML